LQQQLLRVWHIGCRDREELVTKRTTSRSASPDRLSTATSATTIRALDDLADVLKLTSVRFDGLAHRAQLLRDVLADGMDLTRAMAAEERPLIITQMTRLIDELTVAARAVRRSEAQQLQQEGLSHQAIAEVFGVTRQRVGALLAEPVEDAEGAPRKAHRPAR
jgi:hypothetical protein